MLAQPKRKSKSTKEKAEKDKVKHDKSGSTKRTTETCEKVIQIENESAKNKTIITEVSDDNFNSKINNPLSRDISIESQVPLDTQIERGIMNLLEQEIARVDKKQYPPRPQSLSFYEDEFAAEDTDLSGQLQALSPAEKQIIVNRTKNNFMTINANVQTDTSNIVNKNDYDKMAKNGDDYDIGNSREKIVSEQKKIKKQRKTRKDMNDPSSTANSSGTKKSRRRNQSFFNEGYQPKTDITMALDDLQDDVFEGPAPIHGYNYGDSPKSPQYGGISPPIDIPTKIYIGNNEFSAKLKSGHMISTKLETKEQRRGVNESLDDISPDLIPLDIALFLQRVWMPFSTFCHGLLAGVALMNLMMMYVLKPFEHEGFIMAFIELNQYYKTLFFILCIICIVSVFDRYDLAHLTTRHLRDLYRYRQSSIVIIIYLGTFICFLTETNRTGYYQMLDEKTVRIIKHETVILQSLWTAVGAVLGWFILSCSKYDDLLGIHLDEINKFCEESAEQKIEK